MGRTGIWTSAAALALVACAPTIKVQAPDKPIEINLNVNIRQEVVVKLERDVLETLKQNPDIF
jgi:uncharacterized protein (DUF4415 family)